jgi:hypothetical protein
VANYAATIADYDDATSIVYLKNPVAATYNWAAALGIFPNVPSGTNPVQ